MTGKTLLVVKERQHHVNTILIQMLNHVVSHSGMVFSDSIEDFLLLFIGFVVWISRRNTWRPDLSQF